MNKDTTVGLGLHDVARMLRREFDRRARAQGLTRARWQVLWTLNHREGIHQAALAEIMDVAPISLTRQLERLEEEGLVERRVDQTDRRRRRLYLTAEAAPALERLRELAMETRHQALAGIEADDIDTLTRVLGRMRANLCQRTEKEE
ncbi:MarR family winged helix-turn-helix transcriptional regulator [Alloalcanivorax profundimaris]|uniref:MarR family transcriptional regulator n=1 Tax=Alloalcanivorax profundimaris TaxID=2735259 RepID=A0ABS0ANW8_9GAMM|nr:MarR family transcriptional regulator [Alloalcanivorax profundimaris]MAO60386.1 MarR family transcriptional regulator [Alcanivorax sp.]MBM1145276.1 MarR family transcriptional regulator [Alcanivorax sp. ZXX171]MCQ6263373.1 MarR family transcriptional regulator [Alcanivorax sp. MM125-6]UWN49362.1 Transcriptional regulator SlyA [Alcanivorax sp. ALC70]MAY12137.1 MarR family transcriptional regulator [Alcanivorax sp.]|tara:strand:- start:25674 stop:26114 length:441 start_codon:yes stop_codon:yes gene_type:complete